MLRTFFAILTLDEVELLVETLPLAVYEYCDAQGVSPTWLKSVSSDEGGDSGGRWTGVYRGLVRFEATLFFGVFGGAVGILYNQCLICNRYWS